MRCHNGLYKSLVLDIVVVAIGLVVEGEKRGAILYGIGVYRNVEEVVQHAVV